MDKCPVCGGIAEILFVLVSCGNKSCRLYSPISYPRIPRWIHNDPSDIYLETVDMSWGPYDLYLSQQLNHLMYRYGNDNEDYAITAVYDYRLAPGDAKEGFIAAYKAAVKQGYLLP